jgi:N-acetylglucosaminyldiphosphoundecaprenol N-acetyl-beta-D-mannosaminyltransferase
MSSSCDLATTETGFSLPHFKVLGVRVHAVHLCDVAFQMERWVQERGRSHYIALTGMHGVSEAFHDHAFKAILNDEQCMVTPDGMPLVWLGRWHGYPLQQRCGGPELAEYFFRHTGSRYKHFFYGGAPGVANQLAETAQQRFGLQVVGTYCPPFRPLTEEEQQQVVDLVRAAAPDVLWVGLSTPKQERWMAEFLDRLNVPVLVGVGAAFDFNTGRVKRAPGWMREHGLEWLHRLLTEPRRLWRRYLVNGSEFLWNVSLELLHLKEFN